MINFYLKSPNGSKETIIIISVSIKGKGRIKTSTSWKIHPALWDRERQRVNTRSNALIKRHYDQINNPNIVSELKKRNTKLSELEASVRQFTDDCRPRNWTAFKRELQDFIKAEVSPIDWNYHGRAKVLPYFQSFIQKTVSDKSLKPGTIANYESLYKILQRYEGEKDSPLIWEEIDRNEFNSFVSWDFSRKQVKKSSTVWKHIKDLKSVMARFYEQNIHNNNNFSKSWFSIDPGETIKDPLTEKEMTLLYEHSLEPNTTKCKARDLFLIACYTGLRVGDIKKYLKPENIINDDPENPFIRFKTEKTRKLVMIPINENLETILKKYDYRRPKILDGTVNRKIKEIAREVGIAERKCEKLKMCIGRNSFCTALYAEKNISMPDVMNMTGHKSERTFLKYINASAKDTVRRVGGKGFFKRKSSSMEYY